MRTKIIEHDERDVTLRYLSSYTDEVVEMHIWAPRPGDSGMSYVRCDGDKQLCAGLSSGGETLTYYAGTRLVDLVRSEYRAMRRAEKRDSARYA